MNTKDISYNAQDKRVLNALVFTGLHDIQNNPRRGLGHQQLSDPAVPVTLIAALPDVISMGDTVTLYWDGVEQQSYNVDTTTLDTGWLSFSVLPDQIQEPSGEVYYTVDDHSGKGPQPSPTRTIPVKRSVPGGQAPNPETGFNDNLQPPSVEPARFNPATTRTIKVTVAPWENMAEGDFLTVWWDGIPKENISVTQPGIAQTVTLFFGGDEPLNPKVPVSYSIHDKVDNYSRVSPTTMVEVFTSGALPSPVIKEVDPDTLMLDLDALGGADAHVSIPRAYSPQVGDIYTLTWMGGFARSEAVQILVHTVIDPAADPVTTFAIPNAELQRFSRGRAHASYIRRSGGQNSIRAQASALLSGQWPGLAAPVVQGATGNEIDLGQIADPLRITVPVYTGKKEGDRISLVGTGLPLSPPASHLLVEHVVLAGEEAAEQVFEVSHKQLTLLIGGQLKLHYRIQRLSWGLTFPGSDEATYNIIRSDGPISEDFTGQAPNLIQAGESIDTGKLGLNFISGLGYAGFPDNDQLPAEPGSLELPVLHMCYPGVQVMEVDLHGAFTRVQCDVHGGMGSTLVDVLDGNKDVVETIAIPGDQSNYHLDFNNPAQPASYLRITGDRDWSRWDNFLMER
ncbi:hypothetical protein ACIPL1_09670 [Pseudomonas sp. NPDC090202]|uniref:hypothetical protein n=1 Tax=unclassified Pseudomonas TaxID=196821 RepID=UPI0038005021